jgi:hypothetical protein
VTDDSPVEPEESDLRRRAAWLLAMLAVVAILFVVLMTVLLNTDSGNPGKSGATGLDDTLGQTSTPNTPIRQPGSTVRSTPTSASSSRSAPTTTPHGTTSCPSQAPCILDGDVGNAVSAINAYRAQHQKPPIPGSVSPAAQTCALHRGNGCSGGWAETELSTPDGTAAVAKIQQFAHLLDPQMTAIGVGWAYNPSSKTYYFVTIRQD